MSENKPYLQILKSSAIVGSASLLNLTIGLIRTKIAAVVLGPAGIGVIGMFQNLVSTASAVSSLGISYSGSQQIARANGDVEAIASLRRSLLHMTILLAIVGATTFWLLRNLIAEQVLGDSSLAGHVGWLALGVAMSIGSASQGALLSGLRRIPEIAWVSVLSATASTAIAIACLLTLRSNAILPFVLAGPAASLVIGYLFVARLPTTSASAKPSMVELYARWRDLASPGVAFMASGLAVLAGQLVIRSLVQHELGTDALGHFQAAWTISMTYIGFVLGAMSTDYYPRLAASLNDHAATNRMVNEQTEMMLLLVSPIFLAFLGLGSWLMPLLYTNGFGEANSVLRWQILGDILKVSGWPLGFILLAAGDGRKFLFVELLTITTFIATVWLGIRTFGVQSTGIGFLAMYVVYLPVIYWIAKRKTGFSWNTKVRRQLVVLVVAAAAVATAASRSTWLGCAIGLPLTVLAGMFAMVRMSEIIGHRSFPWMASMAKAFIDKFGPRRGD